MSINEENEQLDKELLIAPEGIEIEIQEGKLMPKNILLIAPEGIEIVLMSYDLVNSIIAS